MTDNETLFDRVAALVRSAYPDAELGVSYNMPTYKLGKNRLHVGKWKHGISFYGWAGRDEVALVKNHPELAAHKSTLRIRPEDAAQISDEEFLSLIHAALGD